MSWDHFLAGLKSLFHFEINFPKLTGFINVNIVNRSPMGNRVETTENPPSMTIDIAGLGDPELRRLKQIVAEQYGESGSILLAKTRHELEEFRQTEQDERYQEQIRYFQDKIPGGDVHLLRACVFLKMKHDRDESVGELKAQIGMSYGQRGRNLSNLCSAGYLDSYLRPLYEALLEAEGSPEVAKEKFQGIYNSIVNELPWTVFVNRQSSDDQIKAEILSKTESSQKYGIKWINIHGLGQPNVAKIRNVLQVLEQERPDLHKKIVEDETLRIFVRLELKG